MFTKERVLLTFPSQTFYRFGTSPREFQMISHSSSENQSLYENCSVLHLVSIILVLSFPYPKICHFYHHELSSPLPHFSFFSASSYLQTLHFPLALWPSYCLSSSNTSQSMTTTQMTLLSLKIPLSLLRNNSYSVSLSDTVLPVTPPTQQLP